MRELQSNEEEEIQRLLIQLCLQRLSGSSVLSMDKIAAIYSSLIYVLRHGKPEMSVNERYISGKKTIEQQLTDTYSLYQDIIAKHRSSGIDAMEQTLKGFEAFFQHYDITYGANLEAGIWIDYLLSNPVAETRYGVDFVSDYLQAFFEEDQFLQRFSLETINEVLQMYQQQLHVDYRYDVNNLFDVVFNQAVATWAVCGRVHVTPQTSLLLSEADCSYLFANRSQIMTPSLMTAIVGDNEYYKAAFRKLMKRLTMTSSLKELKHYLLWEKEEQPAILRLAEGMSAVAYNQLTNQLLQQPEDADQLVIRTIESPYDFFMLIEDALLTDYAIKNVLLAMDIVLFAGILLVWRQQYDADIEGLADFLAIEGQQDILAGIQKRIQQLDSGDFQLLETILHTHTLPDLDIS